jgi:deoxyribodipyrimidine photolyase
MSERYDVDVHPDDDLPYEVYDTFERQAVVRFRHRKQVEGWIELHNYAEHAKNHYPPQGPRFPTTEQILESAERKAGLTDREKATEVVADYLERRDAR